MQLLCMKMQMLLLFLSSAKGVRVLRNTIAVGDRVSIGGASLVNASKKVTTLDVTICFKLNAKVEISSTVHG